MSGLNSIMGLNKVSVDYRPAALKACLITLDLRDEALEASEAALRAKAEEIRPAAVDGAQ